ncbi:MAG: putative dihydroxybiphenyl dioxygenase [Candidatus Saccharibacteria bacterium]|nr:putative dihydroxybiphenyl dioxygenase [Candidatus Saccharibacteria bacterium]
MIAKKIIGDYEAFIASIDRGLGRLGIEREQLSMMDHVCYRVETHERYQEMLGKIAGIATLLGETEINGRNIATFEFDSYLEAAGWTVPYLELPEPKAGSPYPEGLEHAEFVVVGNLERFLVRHEDLPFSYNGMSKSINPEAGLKAEGISVKFHEQQLGAVVRIEKRVGITKVEQ